MSWIAANLLYRICSMVLVCLPTKLGHKNEVNVGIHIPALWVAYGYGLWLVKSPLDVFIFLLTQDAVTHARTLAGRGEPDPVSASPGNFSAEKTLGDLSLQTGSWMWKAHGFPRKMGTPGSMGEFQDPIYWRYHTCTIFQAIFLGDIPLHSPKT